ncbi:MAG: hypothetical protein HMLKMBBP_01367 [Planctomycetes bacterium]|nr:hypothetical protein [Planctomycetota bacterium]
MTSATPDTALVVRGRLVEALRLDLVGPGPGDELAEERLPGWIRPSNWYIAGFLVPTGTPPEKRSDSDEDEQDDPLEIGGLAEESNEERKAAKKAYFPSSMGLSFLVPAASRALDVTVRWGEYEHAEFEGPDGAKLPAWRRRPREEVVHVPLDGDGELRAFDVPQSLGLQLQVVEQSVSGEAFRGRLAEGTRSVSLFLVNHRTPSADDPEPTYAFQTELEVAGDHPFDPRPDVRGADSHPDWDEQVADLHYAGTPEYATGHGVAADWTLEAGKCRLIRTVWIPSAEVEKTVPAPRMGVELGMDALGALADGAAAEAALRPLEAQYRDWLAERITRLGEHAGAQRETAEELLRLAGVAADRMEQGIALLARDDQALDAFRVANRAVAEALRRRLPDVTAPKWHPFQLAFLLLNLTGLADPTSPQRDTVDLLFFPTGGGKTEAYLGLAAFAMVLRRLRHPSDDGRRAAGTTVIMRYTLRLLTLDQLGRAAGLVCALELERSKDTARYGTWPFEIGLWVGKATTPNILGEKGDQRSDTARAKLRRFKSNPHHNEPPIPIESCPWCAKRFEPASFSLLPNEDAPRELRIVCANPVCAFARDRALPIVAVDESIYRRLPAFLIATVDKFASLPWVGPSGAILGGADRFASDEFLGPAQPKGGKRLAAPLLPPDLIIQDELHLIAGPLGTMAGLFETAIDALCTREIDGRTVRPKIVASTATVRRAQDQVQALFGRSQTQVFPPPGPDRRDCFFACTRTADAEPARLYLGIASQGRNPKALMRRVVLALMGAGEKSYRDAGGHQNRDNPADPYMTVLGYFNSLRELGGARRILEEEVQNTLKAYGARKRLGEERGLFQDRRTFSEVLELTSRVSTDKVAAARRRLGEPFHAEQRVDCAIATNMISVGLDVPRLGLMVVLGQPKTHSEYIQATSRVGRTSKAPGLVVTLFNMHKPRDRSHYERFRHYHESFYRSVEVASVTPFSARALDRGFAAALVTFARHVQRELTPPEGVERLPEVRRALEERLLRAFLARVDEQPIEDEDDRAACRRSVQDRVVAHLDSWRKVLDDYRSGGAPVEYQKYESRKKSKPKSLLREMLETSFESEDHRRFRANRSLRDVEPDVSLFLHDLDPSRPLVEERP